MKIKAIAFVGLLALAGCSPKDIASVDGMESAITGEKTLDPVAMDATPLTVAPDPAPVVVAASEPIPACVPAFRMPCPGDDE